jgi:hypothetical protein
MYAPKHRYDLHLVQAHSALPAPPGTKPIYRGSMTEPADRARLQADLEAAVRRLESALDAAVVELDTIGGLMSTVVSAEDGPPVELTAVAAAAAEAADVTARHAYELLDGFAKTEREGRHTRRG